MVDPLQLALAHDDMDRLALLREGEMLSIPTPKGELILDRGEASTVLDAIGDVLRYRISSMQVQAEHMFGDGRDHE
jgi:hypothetical protein